MTVLRRSIVSIVLFLAAISVAIAEDGEPNPIFGGPGGGPFTLVCPSEVVQGVTIRSGTWIDAIGVICPSGKKALTGGNGGSAHDFSCPPSQYVSSIKYGFTRDGSKPKFLDYVEVHCTGGASHCFDSGDKCWDRHPNPGPYDGTGLTNVSTCTSSQRINGLTGRSGAYVDALAVQCYPPRPKPASTGTGTSGAGGTSQPKCCWRPQADATGAIFSTYHCDNACP